MSQRWVFDLRGPFSCQFSEVGARRQRIPRRFLGVLERAGAQLVVIAERWRREPEARAGEAPDGLIAAQIASLCPTASGPARLKHRLTRTSLACIIDEL